MSNTANAEGRGALATVRPYLKGLTMILSLVAIGYGLKVSGINDVLDEHWIDAEIRGQGLIGAALFVGMAGVLAAVGFPRQAISFMGGYAFGLWQGTLLALLATTLGCVFAFFYARIMGRSFVQRHFGRRIAKFDRVLADSPFLTTLLIRFLPVGSNVVTNLIAGVSHVRAVPFILGSLVGYLPQTAIFVLIGSGVHIDPTFRTGVGAALFVVSGALGAYLYRHLKRGQAIKAATIDDDGDNL
jgi:uncharacterized membrane protein YdjX (TVP38/TMEM64 family)